MKIRVPLSKWARKNHISSTKAYQMAHSKKYGASGAIVKIDGRFKVDEEKMEKIWAQEHEERVNPYLRRGLELNSLSV